MVALWVWTLRHERAAFRMMKREGMRTRRRWSAGLAAGALLSVGIAAAPAGAVGSSPIAADQSGHIPSAASLALSQDRSESAPERVATIQATHNQNLNVDGQSLQELGRPVLPMPQESEPARPGPAAADPSDTAWGPAFDITRAPLVLPYESIDGPYSIASVSKNGQPAGGFSFNSSEGTAANEVAPHAIPFQTSAQLFPVGAVLAAYAIARVRRKRSRIVPIGK
jgi:hypothetical protein